MRCCEQPRTQLELLQYAMQGEAVASGSMHVDNIAPSLYGGLVLTVGIDHPRVKQIPVPGAIRAVIVHPHMFLSTRQARAILKGSVEMADFVWQTANLAGFISGCYTNDLDMLRDSFEDVVIERAACGADSRVWRGAPRGAVRRGDRLFDLGRGSHGVRLVPAGARRRGARGDGAASSPSTACSPTTGSSAVEPSGARVIG